MHGGRSLVSLPDTPQTVHYRADVPRIEPTDRDRPAAVLPKARRRSTPTAIAQTTRRGPHPAKILVVGDHPMLGWGSGVEISSLPGRLADRIQADTSRGVEIDLRVGPDVTIPASVRMMGQIRLWRYSAVIIAFDPGRSWRRQLTGHWRRHLGRMLDILQSETSFLTQVVVLSTTHPEDADWSTSVRDACAAICERHERTVLVELNAGHGIGNRTESWSDAVAAELLPHLTDVPVEAVDSDHGAEAEDRRVRALHATGVLDTAEDEGLDSIVEQARKLFNARAAELNFIDRDRQWTKAANGIPRGQLPRTLSLCNITLEQPEGLIVGDGRHDERIREHPFVAGAPGIRFYAGIPVESPDGQRIGSLCVWDLEPHETSDSDVQALRELAVHAQRQLARRPTR